MPVFSTGAASATRFGYVTTAAQTFAGFKTYTDGVGSPGSGTASERFGVSASVGSANQATAAGNTATATGAASLAVGYNAQATTTANTAVGASAAADSNTNATAIGYAASADGLESTAVGSTAAANSAFSTIVGSGAAAGTGALNTVLGRSAGATTGANNTVIGAGGAASTHSKAIVLGINAAASGDNQVQLGASADECNVYAWGDVRIATIGKGLKVAEGSNATMGLATLVGGTVTVSTTKVTANSRIILTGQADGGTPGWQRVSARSAGTSFTITSSSGTDTSTVAWVILEPI